MRTSAFLNDRKEVDLMDCFLIKHCIWNEEWQKNAVWQFVSGIVEENGYKLSLELPDIEKELKEFNNEVDVWTHEEITEEYDVPKEYKIQQQEFYRVIIEGIFNYHVDDLINKDEIMKLKNIDEAIETKRHRKDMGDKDTVYIRKSSSENKIMLSNDENNWEDVDFECIKKQRKRKIPKQPHTATIKEWDKRIKVVLTKTSNLKSQIDSYKSKDIKDIYGNLFVDKSCAKHVEKNLNDLWNKIEQLEVEADRIQNAYTKIEPSQGLKNPALIDNEKSI
jgi:MoxR-like ATPase